MDFKHKNMESKKGLPPRIKIFDVAELMLPNRDMDLGHSLQLCKSITIYPLPTTCNLSAEFIKGSLGGKHNIQIYVVWDNYLNSPQDKPSEMGEQFKVNSESDAGNSDFLLMSLGLEWDSAIQQTMWQFTGTGQHVQDCHTCHIGHSNALSSCSVSKGVLWEEEACPPFASDVDGTCFGPGTYRSQYELVVLHTSEAILICVLHFVAGSLVKDLTKDLETPELTAPIIGVQYGLGLVTVFVAYGVRP
ncbi:hypothetical protein BDP27DRAFT_1368638 [Rhodocollybia butyracea]|uniref:Uncharacterized protein n=1 Tax=Rhodocollybia butyracea TaxID=206335 RepID=A0A9P5PG33_9AGAR|nr:hypothetical protein BDP27DRAFT_1368638 [Rhodocollybia butyracea]